MDGGGRRGMEPSDEIALGQRLRDRTRFRVLLRHRPERGLHLTLFSGQHRRDQRTLPAVTVRGRLVRGHERQPGSRSQADSLGPGEPDPEAGEGAGALRDGDARQILPRDAPATEQRFGRAREPTRVLARRQRLPLDGDAVDGQRDGPHSGRRIDPQDIAGADHAVAASLRAHASPRGSIRIDRAPSP